MKATKKLFGAIDYSEFGIEDVFSTYLYTGTGAALDIVNGIDLDGIGGMVWLHSRGPTAYGGGIYDSERDSFAQRIQPFSTTAQALQTNQITSALADGFSLGTDNMNNSGNKYVSWTFRKASRFFDESTVTKSGGSDATVDFSDLETLGMVIVKRIDSAGSWYVWHKELTAGKLLYLEQTAAEATLGQITVSGTTVTLEDSVITDGTYIIYGFAHDPLGLSGDGRDGLIACGSYLGDGATPGPDVSLGWEPQYLLIKGADEVSNWRSFDVMRGIPVGGSNNTMEIEVNSSAAEVGRDDFFRRSADGFGLVKSDINTSGKTYIYMAIRRPMKTPKSADEVFAVDASNNSDIPAFTSNFPVDMAIKRDTGDDDPFISSRLIQGKYLDTSAISAEAVGADYLFDYMDGWYGNTRSATNYSWMFKRATGFFDVVCYTGTGVAGRTVSHNLGVVPEMIWIKNRGVADAWAVYAGDETDYLVLNTTAATADLNTYWNDTAPTESVFTVGTVDNVNASTETYIAYLFATLLGISKVGSYTGDGTTGQTINCGFSSGASLILIKRTDDTGDWFLWDSVRGIIAGNDPHLSLNTTAAEVTTDDSIDPNNSGFIVNQVAATNVNVDTAEYIFYAVAAI